MTLSLWGQAGALGESCSVKLGTYSGLLCLATNQTRSRMRGTEYGRTTATTICAHVIMQF